MNKISKQYIKNVKAFFPIIGKKERNYLKGLEMNIKDYCEEVAIASLDELYEKFGTPTEVVNAYYSNIDIEYIIKQISKKKTLRTLVIAIVLLAFTTVSAYCILLYSQFQVFESERVHFIETVIE